MSGFAQVTDLLASRPGAVRILIGRADRPTMAEIAAGCHAGQNHRQEAAAAAETLANVGRNAAAQPQDDASEAGIKSLAALVASGKVEGRLPQRPEARQSLYGLYGHLQRARHGDYRQRSCSAAGCAGNTELNYPVIHGGDVGTHLRPVRAGQRSCGRHEPAYCGQLRRRTRPAQDAAQRRADSD